MVHQARVIPSPPMGSCDWPWNMRHSQTGRQRRMGAKSVVRAHGETLSEAQGPASQVSAYDEVIGRITHLVSNPPAKAVSARTPKACFGCGGSWSFQI